MTIWDTSSCAFFRSLSLSKAVCIVARSHNENIAMANGAGQEEDTMLSGSGRYGLEELGRPAFEISILPRQVMLDDVLVRVQDVWFVLFHF